MTGVELLAVAAAFLAGTLLGITVGRGRRERALDDAADYAAAKLRAAQVDEDGDALRQLPPTVSAADALEHAARLGISVAEAAEDLYRRRVRALLVDRFRRETLRPRTDRPPANPGADT